MLNLQRIFVWDCVSLCTLSLINLSIIRLFAHFSLIKPESAIPDFLYLYLEIEFCRIKVLLSDTIDHVLF